jgi:type IV pilus assembly protein PilM
MAKEVKRPGVWGIDLGQCALKAIRLEEIDGQIKATAFDYIEHPKILSQPDADPDQLTREALDKFLSRNDLKGDTVAISVPGQSGLARFVKLPPVDEKKIPDIVRFEAKQQIPFPLDEVVWAYQRLGAGVVTDNMVLDAEIGLFAMKRDMVNRYLQHFKDVNVEVHVIQMAPLALCNFLAHDLLKKGVAGADEEGSGEKNCVVALDIGADNSNLVITDGEKIIWQRPIPLGGNHFTRALTKDLKLTFAKAEHLKRNAVKSPDLKKILAALKPVLNDFVSEVQRSLGYFTNTHRDANIMYMMGLGNAFRLPGLQKYLQEKLQLEVRKLQKIERLEGEEAVVQAPQYVENVLSFAVAHGLALQGLKATRVYTNLLPQEIAQERFIRAKKPWAVAAAAVLLLLAPPLLLGYAANLRAWTNKRVTDAAGSLKNAVSAARSDVDNFDKATAAADDAKRKVLAMAGGINERLNWMHLNAFIDETLPQPDDGYGKTVRLSRATRDGVNAFETYWHKDMIPKGKENAYFAGDQAWARYNALRAKLTSGQMPTPEDQQEEENIKKALIKVHIEGVEAMYSDDLPTEFFEKLLSKDNESKTCARLLGLSSTEQGNVKTNKSNLPKAGWLIEIRGFTYHQDGERFLRSTFVENMRELAEIDSKESRIDRKFFPAEARQALRMEVADASDSNKKTEKSRVGYFLVYEFYRDAKPLPGQFELIKQSKLPEALGLSVASSAPGPGVPMPGQKTGPGPESSPAGKDKEGSPPEPDKKDAGSGSDRGSWHPPGGTLIGESMGGGGAGAGVGAGGGFPGMPIPGDKGRKGVPPPKFGDVPFPGGGGTVGGTGGNDSSIRRQQRTEFIILFVWQEPLPAEGAAQPGQPPQQK